jgi:hypothetical protein
MAWTGAPKKSPFHAVFLNDPGFKNMTQHLFVMMNIIGEEVHSKVSYL